MYSFQYICINFAHLNKIVENYLIELSLIFCMIPYFKLNNGVKIPSQGLGTFTLKGSIMTNSIKTAFESGCTLIDTASAYMNEHYVGSSIKELERQGILKRSDLFIETKVGDKITSQGKPIGYYFYNSPSCPNHDTKKVVNLQIENSLRLLQTDYLDLVMIHWPYFDVLNDIWAALEDLYEQGIIKSIGVSNCRKRHVERILRKAKVCPMVNQTNISPINTQVEDLIFFHEHNIQVQAYSPLGCLRNERFKKEQFLLMEELPRKYNKTIQQILFRWFFQKGIITIPKSKTPSRIIQNVDIYDFELSDLDIAKFDACNFNYQHLIESLYCPGY